MLVQSGTISILLKSIEKRNAKVFTFQGLLVFGWIMTQDSNIGLLKNVLLNVDRFKLYEETVTQKYIFHSR